LSESAEKYSAPWRREIWETNISATPEEIGSKG